MVTATDAWGIDIDSLWKVFANGPDREPTVALQDVNLSVDPGKFVALIGRSGCGKTTLLRCVGGLTRPTDGGTRINGAPLHNHHGRLNRDVLGSFGFAFQDPNLLPWRSTIENIALPLQLANELDDAGREHAGALADAVGLGEFRDALPKQLSGGMKQRVSLARSLIRAPRVLLMDEPFGALDAMTRESMNRLMHDLWRSHGNTVVLVTHSVQEAVFLANRVIVMTPRPGRIAYDLKIDLPEERTTSVMGSKQFVDYVSELRNLLGAEGHDE